MHEILHDIQEKKARVRSFMKHHGLSAVVINRRDNFAWITAGGDNHIVKSRENGFGWLVFTVEHDYLIAEYPDAARLMEEELIDQSYEPIVIRWHSDTVAGTIQRLVGDGVVGSDSSMPGYTNINSDLQKLHYPLTNLDMDRTRHIGRECDTLLWEIAQEIKPGMSERKIASLTASRYFEAGYELDVILIGADDRIQRYRHPLPSNHKLEQTLLIHPAANKWGLHANITRMLGFGTPPAINRDAHRAASLIHGTVLKNLSPGISFASILALEKKLYAELVNADEWTCHYQGGITGYLLVNPTLCWDEHATISHRQAFDYFLTVTGGKVEELSVVDNGPGEIVSCGSWPTEIIHTSSGTISTPQFVIR